MSQARSIPDVTDPAADRRFIRDFVLLALVSGITIGITKVVNALLALHLGASPFQVSLIVALETAGMFIVTIPAGFLIERYGPRPVYLISSVIAAAAYLASPWTTAWWQLLPIAVIVGLCIPFRVVSMSGSFFQRLRTLGAGKTGWYRGSLMTGILLLGPFAGSLLQQHSSFLVTYLVVSGLFLLMGNASLGVLPQRISNQATGATPGAVLRGIFGLLRQGDVARPCLVEFAGGLTGGFFATFVILIGVQQFGASPVAAVVPLAVQGAAFVTVLFAAGRSLTWLGRDDYYGLAHGITCLGLATLGLAGSLVGLAIGAGLLGIGLGMQHLANVHAISASSVEKGRVSGLFTFAGTAGSFVGLLASGSLTHWIGLQTVFLAWIPLFLLVTGPLVGLLPALHGETLPRWPRIRRQLATWSFGLGYALIFLLAWDAVVRFRIVPPQVIVSPERVWEAIHDLTLSGELWQHILASLLRVGGGFVFGSVAGLAFGLAYSLWSPVRAYTRLLFEAIRQVPTVGWIPLLILAFGIEESFKVIVIALSVFFPVALAAIDGIKGVPPRFLEVADALRFSTVTRVRKVIIPAALPDIATGLRLGLSRAWMIVVGAELFGSESGLGHLMDWGRQLFQMDLLLAAVLVTAVIGYLIDRLFTRIEGRFQTWKRNPVL
jgi:ABC-type nitrate/sulfonate/bicarbonate transport system permease component/MFS family permease